MHSVAALFSGNGRGGDFYAILHVNASVRMAAESVY